MSYPEMAAAVASHDVASVRIRSQEKRWSWCRLRRVPVRDFTLSYPIESVSYYQDRDTGHQSLTFVCSDHLRGLER